MGRRVYAWTFPLSGQGRTLPLLLLIYFILETGRSQLRVKWVVIRWDASGIQVIVLSVPGWALWARLRYVLGSSGVGS